MRASNPSVAFESRLPAGLAIEADSLEIELVLRNLVKNAGESAAALSNPETAARPRRRVGASRGRSVVLTVTDNGPVTSRGQIEGFVVPLRSEKSAGSDSGSRS